MATFEFLGGDLAQIGNYSLGEEEADRLPDTGDIVTCSSDDLFFGSIAVGEWHGGILNSGSLTATKAYNVGIAQGNLQATRAFAVRAGGTEQKAALTADRIDGATAGLNGTITASVIVNATAERGTVEAARILQHAEAQGGSIEANAIVNTVRKSATSGDVRNLIAITDGGEITTKSISSTTDMGITCHVDDGHLLVDDFNMANPAGQRTELVVTDGGRVTVRHAMATGRLLGDLTEVYIDGPGSSLSMPEPVFGNAGVGRLHVSGGATPFFSPMILGRKAPAQNNNTYGVGEVDVGGDGSKLRVVSLTVGEGGSGSVSVAHKAVLDVDKNLVIARGEQALGFVRVFDAQAFVDQTTVVGVKGNGSLEIFAGSSFAGVDMILSQSAGSKGTLRLSGLNELGEQGPLCKMGLSDSLRVGVADFAEVWIEHKAQLIVSNRIGITEGTMDVTSGSAIRASALAIGTTTGKAADVTLSGQGSRLGVVNLVVGDKGNGSLHIDKGAFAVASGLTIGDELGSIGDVTVASGNGRSFADCDLTIGFNGRGTLTVSNKSNLSTLSGAGEIVIGARASADGSKLAIAGGSKLTSDTVKVGGEVTVGGTASLVLSGTSSATISDLTIFKGSELTVKGGSDCHVTTLVDDGVTRVAGGGTLVVSEWFDSEITMIGDKGTLGIEDRALGNIRFAKNCDSKLVIGELGHFLADLDGFNAGDTIKIQDTIATGVRIAKGDIIITTSQRFYHLDCIGPISDGLKFFIEGPDTIIRYGPGAGPIDTEHSAPMQTWNSDTTGLTGLLV